MVTLIKDPFVDRSTATEQISDEPLQTTHPSAQGYSGYVEPDTKIPPKAKPVLNEVSVNGVAILESEVLNEAQHHPSDTPGKALIAAAKALVVRQLMLQEATKLALVPEAEVHDDGRMETQEDALVRQLIEREVQAPLSSRQERHRYYEAHQQSFQSETIYEARHILLASRNDEQAEANSELAGKLIAALQADASAFDDFARAHSSCPSASEGGNLGQLTKGSTVPEFEAVLEKMEPGQIWSEPVASRYGLHIIYLVNKVPGQLLPFEMAEERIGAWLEASSWSKAVAQYVSILVGKADITGIQIEGVDSPLVQ